MRKRKLKKNKEAKNQKGVAKSKKGKIFGSERKAATKGPIVHPIPPTAEKIAI